MNKPAIKIDIVSDVVCPWCYIGKRRLEKALGQLSDRFDFVLEYHPFELNPDMSMDGANQQTYLSKKFGGKAQYEQITNHVTTIAAQDGLSFHFERQSILPNTRNAHRLVQLANHEGKQLPLVERLFKAYFTDGIDLSKNENLVLLAAEVGLEKDKTEKLLVSDEGSSEVASAEKQMQQLGITGVPFYIINNTYGISGAQAPATFVRAIEEMGLSVVSGGEACDIDGNNC